MILSPGVRFLSCSTSGQGHQPERTLSVASPGATVQWLRPRRKFSQNLVVKNKPFVVLKDAVGQNSDRALCGQLVSASCCLESHLEKSKAGGRSPLKASSSACWGGRWRLLAGASVPVRISLCVANFGLPQGLMARSQGWEWRVEKPHPFL